MTIVRGRCMGGSKGDDLQIDNEVGKTVRMYLRMMCGIGGGGYEGLIVGDWKNVC